VVALGWLKSAFDFGKALLGFIPKARKWSMASKAAKEADAQKRRADASIDGILQDAKRRDAGRKR
jgi:hypothetical protein